MAQVDKNKIIFITLIEIKNIRVKNLYADLMRHFVEQGFHVTIVYPAERRLGEKTIIEKSDNVNILKVRCPNIQKTNVVEKTLGTLLIDHLLKRAIRKYLGSEQFDLAIYSTPPITIVHTIQYLKDKYDLKTYLLLKDIFPQNAIDLNLFKEQSVIHRFFKKKEKLLYRLSDKIGCMSEANVNFILKHNCEFSRDKVELCPNSIEVDTEYEKADVKTIKDKFNIPYDCRVFVYGGNLGKPQGIDFLIKILEKQKDNSAVFFIIVGSGTEYSKIEKWYTTNNPPNVLLKSHMDKSKYDEIVSAADVGLIFLDYRFTIPNYPSRLLGYLEKKKPILAITDANTDIGSNAVARGYGRWCQSNNLADTCREIDFFCSITKEEINKMGDIGYMFLKENYSVKNAYEIIIKSIS